MDRTGECNAECRKVAGEQYKWVCNEDCKCCREGQQYWDDWDVCLPAGLSYQQAAISAGRIQIDCDWDPPEDVVVDKDELPPEDPRGPPTVEIPPPLPPAPWPPAPPKPGDDVATEVIDWLIEWKPETDECMVPIISGEKRPCTEIDPPTKKCKVVCEEMSEVDQIVSEATGVGTGTPDTVMPDATHSSCSCKEEKKDTIVKGKICRTATKEEKQQYHGQRCMDRYASCIKKASEGYGYSWCSRRKRRYPTNGRYARRYVPYYDLTGRYSKYSRRPRRTALQRTCSRKW